METLSQLFGGENRVKLMRLFLFNPDSVLDIREISDRVKLTPKKTKKDLSDLEKTGLIKKRIISRKKRSNGYFLYKEFPYLSMLQSFLINTEPLNSKEIIKKLGKMGSLKLIIVAGVFIQNSESRVDILVVGDNIKRSRFENMMSHLEAEVGKELKYAYFTTEDFKYRYNMFDKLVRDILDYPHKKVLNKLGIV